jgi:hypothetical protein
MEGDVTTSDPIIKPPVTRPSGGKKKKKQKKEKFDELEPLKEEALRLNKLPNSTKPYYFKPDYGNGGNGPDPKIIKFSKVPKNLCLYCA